MRATVFALVVLLAAAHARAQSPGEISFWESVRDSKNAAELQAYLDQYPNGTFAALARSRMAALGQKPAAAPAVASPAPAGVAKEKHTPQTGDTWIYRLSYPRLRGQWGQPARPPVTHAVTLAGIENGKIVDQLSVDGGTPVSLTHDPLPTLLVQGASIFSPYLQPAGSGRLGSINIQEPGCVRGFLCEAKGRVSGTETVQVPAGKFLATRVVIDQEWRGASVSGQGAGRLNGGRTLTVWYAPEIGRAVKYSSRLNVGDLTPMDGNFDLELVSYQLK